MKVFKFMSPKGSYKLAVHATSLSKAREYVKGQALSSLIHRTLKYVGEGHPSDPSGWVGAIIRSS